MIRCFIAFSLVIACAHGAVDFAADIQPIFVEHCYECHGPDTQKGKLRLDQRERGLKGGESGPAIEPGNASSLLIELVKGVNPDEVMPPKKKKRLSAAQIATLEQWISEGAEWPADSAHWAYRELERPTPPGSGHPIDAFVRQRLESAKIAPSPEADRTTLIKRLYYDLLGLPPAPAAVDAFVADASPDAYEKLVDQLLASPRFGERWGRHWLDKARYADSDGYEKDRNRPNAWRYRDWVIDAINRDLPYDRFVIEQLAGDMLPNATPLQRLATAFNRQTLTNTEGGADQEQFRVAAVMDRTETLGTVWLGLTVGCARCHTHKYDQLTQDEYFQLYAFFNDANEANTTVPRQMRTPQQDEIDALQAKVDARRAELTATLDDWIARERTKHAANSANEMQFHPMDVTKIDIPGTTTTQLEDGSILTSGANPETAKYRIHFATDVKDITGIRIEALADDSLPKRGPGRTAHGNFVLNEVRLYVSDQPNLKVAHKVPLVGATADFAQRNWPAKNAIDGKEGTGTAGTGWAISPQMGKDHSLIVAAGSPIRFAGKTHLQVVLSQTYGSQHTIGRFRISAVTGNIAGGNPLRELLLAKTANKDALLQHYLAQDEIGAKLNEELAALRAKADGGNLNVRVMAQSKRATKVLHRGDFLQPLHEVKSQGPAILPPVPARSGGQPDRLDLARWLVNGENPLPPRVVVNQIWKNLFGHGLVRTMNDFGVRGERPTHPELLDHLAGTFIDSGWSRKALIKHIAMSASYRQTSQHRPELATIDPNNHLLYRQNRFRVEAETVRDIALAASGLLSDKLGGPSVFPPIPKGVTELTYNSGFKWKTSGGEDRFRRGMYTFFKRTAPHPNLITLDCPDSNVTSVERNRSNTPIGALVTLNNAVFAESAAAMGHRVLSERDDDAARIEHAFRLCVARPPTAPEQQALSDLLAKSRAWYADNSEAAKKLVGSYGHDGVPVAESAAWVATLRVALNLDEFITRE